MGHPLTLDLQRQILTCDTLAAQQGADDQGLMPPPQAPANMAQRLRQEEGVFSAQYNRDRASSSGDGSANTVSGGFGPDRDPPLAGSLLPRGSDLPSHFRSCSRPR